MPTSRRSALRPVAKAMVALTVMTVAVTGIAGVRPLHAPTIAVHDSVLSVAQVAEGATMTVPTGLEANMVGFTWQGGAAKLQLRAWQGSTWSDWSDLAGEPDEGPDPGSPESRPGQVSAGPEWVGQGTTQIELRVVSGSVQGLQLHAIDSQNATPDPFGVKVADAAVQSPFIASRADWGADESWRTINDGCSGSPTYARETRFGVVHHTVNSNNYGPGDVPAMLRGIYQFHTHSNGWCDIGYNFLIDRFGQTWEGRAGGTTKSVIGAHAGGFNTYSTGVSLIGNFDTASVPGAAYAALRNLLAWKLGYHGIDPLGTNIVYPYDSPFSRFPAGEPVEVSNISGHTDVDSTECPGRYLYALLDRLRVDVALMINSQRDVRMMCDVNGDGTATPVAFQNGWWLIRKSNSEGGVDLAFQFGDPGDIPVCGDWNADGKDTVGIVRGGMWFLRNDNSTGIAEAAFPFGNAGDYPVAGDWNGDGRDSVGVVRGNQWFLAEVGTVNSFPYGDVFDRPVVGDWNGDGLDTPGVYRQGMWFLRDVATGGAATQTIPYGNPSDSPVPYVASTENLPSLTLPTKHVEHWALGIARGSIWHLSDDVGSGKAANIFAY